MRHERKAPPRCSGPGCPVCLDAEERFEQRVASAEVQWSRAADPATHPYAAGKHRLHRAGCRSVERHTPRRDEDRPEALREFAHGEGITPGWVCAFTFMTEAEAVGWLAEGLGPRGGNRRKLCGTCRPAVTA